MHLGATARQAAPPDTQRILSLFCFEIGVCAELSRSVHIRTPHVFIQIVPMNASFNFLARIEFIERSPLQ